MSFKRDMVEFDGDQRAAEKHASRESDLARLRAGDVDARSLNAENNFFASLKLVNLRIAAIGGRPIKQVR